MFRLTPRGHPFREMTEGALMAGKSLTETDLDRLLLPDGSRPRKRLRALSEEALELKRSGNHAEARRMVAEGVDELYDRLPERWREPDYNVPDSAEPSPDELAETIRGGL